MAMGHLAFEFGTRIRGAPKEVAAGGRCVEGKWVTVVTRQLWPSSDDAAQSPSDGNRMWTPLTAR